MAARPDAPARGTAGEERGLGPGERQVRQKGCAGSIFAGNFIGEAEVKQAALAWIPEPMRFAPPPVEQPEASREPETVTEPEAVEPDDGDSLSAAETGDGAGAPAADMGGNADRASEPEGGVPLEVEIEEAA